MLLFLVVAAASASRPPAARPSLDRRAIADALPSAASASSPLRALRLVGGAGGVVIRVMSKDGIKKVSLPSESATLAELQAALQRESKILRTQQRLSRGGQGRDPFDSEADAQKTLKELGLEHGSTIHVERVTGSTGSSAAGASSSGARASAAPAPPPPRTSGGAARQRAKRSRSMRDIEDEAAARAIALSTPKAPNVTYVSVDPKASERFVEYLLDTEFEERRYAYLFGSFSADSKEREGVCVDVVYEPPQECDADAMAAEAGEAAEQQLAHAQAIAKALGLSWVGMAYAHPPRSHVCEATELRFLTAAAAEAAELDPEASRRFVGVRFRPVYEGEQIDGDVTAEAYQPTEQCAKFVGDGTLVDAPGEPGAVVVAPNAPFDLSLNGEVSSQAPRDARAHTTAQSARHGGAGSARPQKHPPGAPPPPPLPSPRAAARRDSRPLVLRLSRARHGAPSLHPSAHGVPRRQPRRNRAKDAPEGLPEQAGRVGHPIQRGRRRFPVPAPCRHAAARFEARGALQGGRPERSRPHRRQG